MTESGMPAPMIGPVERNTFNELRQVTIREDEEIAAVNRLLSDGWRLVNVGFQSTATVYVLGRREDRPRHRAGFVSGE